MRAVRTTGVLASAVAITGIAAAPAFADVTVYTINGKAHYASDTNKLTVTDEGCDSRAVYAEYHWASVDDNSKSVWDYHCPAVDGPVTVTLSPPSSATGIWLRVCRNDPWGLDECSSWVKTSK
jgi:hypothetical protein